MIRSRKSPIEGLPPEVPGTTGLEITGGGKPPVLGFVSTGLADGNTERMSGAVLGFATGGGSGVTGRNVLPGVGVLVDGFGLRIPDGTTPSSPKRRNRSAAAAPAPSAPGIERIRSPSRPRSNGWVFDGTGAAGLRRGVAGFTVRAESGRGNVGAVGTVADRVVDGFGAVNRGVAGSIRFVDSERGTKGVVGTVTLEGVAVVDRGTVVIVRFDDSIRGTTG